MNDYNIIGNKYYEWMEDSPWNGIIGLELEKAVSQIYRNNNNTNYGWRHLDLCCGDGRWVDYVKNNIFIYDEPFDFSLGIDSCLDYIKKANDKYNNPNIVFGDADLKDESLWDLDSYYSRQFDDGYDFVSCIFGMFHFEPTEQIHLLMEINSILRTNGVLMFNVPRLPMDYVIENWQGWGEDTRVVSLGYYELYKPLLTAVGFTNIEDKTYTVNEGDRKFESTFIIASKSHGIEIES